MLEVERLPEVVTTVTSEDDDARTTAVLAVLGGVSSAVVAQRYGISEGKLDRWVARFVDAGRAGLGSGAEETPVHRDHYLSLVAHELRSPLAMIKGWAELLEPRLGPEVLHRARSGILAQAERLARLADDALDATSVALGRLDLNRQVVQIGAALDDIVRARSLDIPTITVHEENPVNIDLDRFGQVVDNLLENARKHASGPAKVSVGRKGDYAEVTITSAGARIEPMLARRMFEPFERGSSGVDGMGLGLYVCRSLIVAHDGQIGLRVDDDGNHFWVRVPIHDGPPSP